MKLAETAELVGYLAGVLSRMELTGREETTPEEGRRLAELMVRAGCGDLVSKYATIKEVCDVLGKTEEGDSGEGSSDTQGDKPS